MYVEVGDAEVEVSVYELMFGGFQTTASVICRLEDADYEGHSMAMLRRVSASQELTVAAALSSPLITTGLPLLPTL